MQTNTNVTFELFHKEFFTVSCRNTLLCFQKEMLCSLQLNWNFGIFVNLESFRTKLKPNLQLRIVKAWILPIEWNGGYAGTKIIYPGDCIVRNYARTWWTLSYMLWAWQMCSTDNLWERWVKVWMRQWNYWRIRQRKL